MIYRQHKSIKLANIEHVQHVSISNIRTSSHDSPIFAADVGLSCRVQSLPSLQAPRPCSVLKFLRTQREVFSFADCLRNVMIKHSLNSVFAWYPELSNLVSVLSASAFGFSRWLRPRFWQFVISYKSRIQQVLIIIIITIIVNLIIIITIFWTKRWRSLYVLIALYRKRLAMVWKMHTFTLIDDRLNVYHNKRTKLYQVI